MLLSTWEGDVVLYPPETIVTRQNDLSSLCILKSNQIVIATPNELKFYSPTSGTLLSTLTVQDRVYEVCEVFGVLCVTFYGGKVCFIRDS